MPPEWGNKFACSSFGFCIHTESGLEFYRSINVLFRLLKGKARRGSGCHKILEQADLVVHFAVDLECEIDEGAIAHY